MSFDPNLYYWGSSSSDIDPFYLCTPPASCVPSNTPNCDYISDMGENLDPRGSLELLQTLHTPIPCEYEPRDEWLVEFERLRDVHDRAPAMATAATAPPPPQPAPPPPPSHHGNEHRAELDVAGGGGGGGVVVSANSGCDFGPPGTATMRSRPACARTETPRCVRDVLGNVMPTPARAGGQISDGPDGPDGLAGPAPYPSFLYSWTDKAAHDNRQPSGVRRVEAAMGELRAMERALQAQTRRRMSQLEQTLPD